MNFHICFSLAYSSVFPFSHLSFKFDGLKWDSGSLRKYLGFVWKIEKCVQTLELGEVGLMLNLSCCFGFLLLRNYKCRQWGNKTYIINLFFYTLVVLLYKNSFASLN